MAPVPLVGPGDPPVLSVPEVGPAAAASPFAEPSGALGLATFFSSWASLLPGEEELRALGRSLLTLGGGKPLSAMDAPVGVNLTVRRGEIVGIA